MEHFISGRPKDCSSCENAILNNYLLQIEDKYYHEECLKCADCDVTLTQQCFVRDDKLLCLNDYLRRKHCFKCRLLISPTEFIQKAKFMDDTVIYHVHCYQCSVCCTRLQPGQEYVINDDGRLVCSDPLCSQPTSEDNEADDDSLNRNMIGRNAHVTSFESPSEKHDDESKRKSETEFDWLSSNNIDDVSLPDSVEFNLPSCGADAGLLPRGGASNQSGTNNEVFEGAKSPPNCSTNGKTKGKRRGPRTTIKPSQLEALKAAFDVSQKPAKSIRESLSKETGLEMRVIQVWFQNRRSKERRVNQTCKLNGNHHFYSGNMTAKYHNHNEFTFMNPNFQDQYLHSHAYPRAMTSHSGRGQTGQYNRDHYSSKPAWSDNDTNNRFLKCKSHVMNDSMTPHCSGVGLHKEREEELYSGLFSHKQRCLSSDPPETTNLTLHPYQLISQPDPLIMWPHHY